MEENKNFKNAINSESYKIIKEYVINHKEDWLNHLEWKQIDFVEQVLQHTKGITVCPETVCVYVGDILKRLGIKERNIKGNNPYKEEELKEFLGGNQLSFNITMCLIQNIHVVGWIEEEFQNMYNINKKLLGEEQYNKCMKLDKDRLKCGYIIGKNGKKKFKI